MKFFTLLSALTLLIGGFSTHASETIANGILLVCNKGDRSLGLIDVAAGKMFATVPEDGVTGHEVAATADGQRAFVPVYGNSGVGHAGTDGQLIRVVDLAQRAVVGTIDLGTSVRPHCAVMGPKNGLLYVTTEISNCVTVIDPQSLKVVSNIPTGEPESHMLAITLDGQRGYTANVASGTVSVLDLAAKKLLAIIPVCKTTQRISLSTDDRWVFTSDQQQPRLAVIDTQTNGVAHWINLPAAGYGSAPTPDGRWLLVVIPKLNQVAVIDLDEMKVAHTLDVGKAPQEVLVRPDGLEAYVSCAGSKQVAVIETRAWTVKKLIAAGAGADGLAWAKQK